VTPDEASLPILRSLALRQARQRLLAGLARRPTLWPFVERSGIKRHHFGDNRKWQEAFEMVRSGADIRAFVVGNPNCETAYLWRLGVEMGAGAMLALAAQIVRSARAEREAEAASVVAGTDQDEADFVEVSAAKPQRVTATGAVMANSGNNDLAATNPEIRQPRSAERQTDLPIASEAPARRNNGLTATAAAVEFLKGALADGPVASNDVFAAAKATGIAAVTLRRAKKAIGVQAKHDHSFDGGWKWSLQDDHSEMITLGAIACPIEKTQTP
jgi:hypothetical protein